MENSEIRDKKKRIRNIAAQQNIVRNGFFEHYKRNRPVRRLDKKKTEMIY